MKDFLPLKKQPLPNHVERNFFKACKLSATEHGYTGFMASFRFLYRRYMDYFWQMLAFRAIPYSKLRVKVHRWRGVKIGKNVMIGPQVVIDDVYPNFVVIEDGVSLAANDYILSLSNRVLRGTGHNKKECLDSHKCYYSTGGYSRRRIDSGCGQRSYQRCSAFLYGRRCSCKGYQRVRNERRYPCGLQTQRILNH